MGTESFRAYLGAFPVRRILGYENGMPVWGEPGGIYHPFKSEIIPVRFKEWQLWQVLSQGVMGINQIEDKTALNYLRENRLVFASGERIVIPDVVLDGGEKAEVYFQTNSNCNLNCADGGCIADRKLVPGSLAKIMTPEFASKVMRRTINSARELGFKDLKLKYAGGEVTMSAPLKLIMGLQEVIEDERNVGGIEIEQVVITNGTFLHKPEVIRKLKQIGAHVAVSIWGWGEKNDQLRGVRRPPDNFTNIITGLKNLDEAGLSYNLALTVHPDTADQLPKIIEAVWDIESPNFIACNWCREMQPLNMGINLWRPTNAAGAEMMKNGGYEKVVAGLRAGFAKILDLIDREIPVRPLDKLDFLTPFSPKATACGMGFNYLAAGVTGLSSCHGQLYRAIENWSGNLIQKVNSEWDNKWPKLVGRNMNWGNMELAKRLTLSWHGGSGCPWQAFLENGDFGYPANVAKLAYTQLLEELLAVEMYRRVKTGESSPRF